MSQRRITVVLGSLALSTHLLSCSGDDGQGAALDGTGGDSSGINEEGQVPLGSGAATSTGGANSGTDGDGSGASTGSGSTSGAGGSTNGSGGSGTGGGPGGNITPVSCTSPFLDPSSYTSGLPLLTSNPGAGVVLYADFDGGNYGGSDPLGPYYTGTQDQREAIVRSFNYMMQYFAMFDLSITTDASKIGPSSGASAWGWIVVSPDTSGGQAQYGGIGTFTSYAKARCSSTTMTSSDKSRRIAHELGHNMDLYHNGLYENGVFCKFEDCNGWDGKYGPIMGGGGEGERNGWGLAKYDPGRGGSDNNSNLQDSMAKIRKVVRELGGSTANDGWATDDFPAGTNAPLCQGSGGELYRIGVLGNPGDVDTFAFTWPGGPFSWTATAPGVSAALVDVTLANDSGPIAHSPGATLPAGNYTLAVESQGAYGSIGYYELRLAP